MPRKLIVEIVGDSRALERSYARSTHATRKFGTEVGRAGRGAIAASGAFRSLGHSVAFASSAFLGGAGLIAVTKSAIEGASSLVEAEDKVKVVFGESADAIEDWSKTTAESMGIGQRKALQFAGVFGNIFVPMGIARKEAAQFSMSLVQLASDMSSFNDASPEDVLMALRAGIVGQARPLRIYGVMLSEARVKAEALSEGIVKLSRNQAAVAISQKALAIAEGRVVALRAAGKKGTLEYAQAQLGVERAAQRVAKAAAGAMPELNDQQKILARYGIILKDTAIQQGNFADTLGHSLANQMRVFTGLVEDLQDEMGKVLLPMVLDAVKAFNKWLGEGDNRARAVDALRSAVGLLTGAIKGAWDVGRRIADMFGGWKTALELLVGAWAGFKLAGITAAAAIEFANIQAAAGTAAAWRAALISTGFGALAVAAGVAAAYVVTHWEKVKTWFQGFWLWLKIGAYNAALAVVEPFSHLPSKLGEWARDAKDQLKAAVQNMTFDMVDLGRKAGKSLGAGIEEGLKEWATGARGKALSTLEDAGFTDTLIGPGGKVITKPTKPSAALKPKGAGGGDGGGGGGGTTPAPTPTTFTTTTWRERFQGTLARMGLSLSRAEQRDQLGKQLAIVNQMTAAVEAQLRLHKGDLELQQRLVDLEGQRLSLQQEMRDKAAAAAQARQFRALGLAADGSEVVPGIAGLRRRLGSFERNYAGTFLDTDKTRARINGIRKVLAGGLGTVKRETRAAIKGILDAWDDELKQGQAHRVAFRKANVRAMLRGLGLDPAEIRAVSGRLATIGRTGTVPGTASVAFAGAGAVHIGTVHVHGVQDPRKFEDHMRKRQRSRPVQRRGA